MKQLLLIRHGESLHNASGNCLSGITDVPLTAVGISQAEALKPIFKNLEIDKVYSSPLSRAVETARLAIPDLAKSIQIADCLLEFDYGDYEGVSSDKLNPSDPILYKWNHSPGDLCFPNGSCIAEHAERVYVGFQNLVTSTNAQCIACFSHKTTIRLLVAKIQGTSLDLFRNIPCQNRSITKINYLNGQFIIDKINSLFINTNGED